MNINELISFFKFGYTGETIDLIYLVLISYFLVWPLLKIIYSKLKGGIKDE